MEGKETLEKEFLHLRIESLKLRGSQYSLGGEEDGYRFNRDIPAKFHSAGGKEITISFLEQRCKNENYKYERPWIWWDQSSHYNLETKRQGVILSESWGEMVPDGFMQRHHEMGSQKKKKDILNI